MKKKMIFICIISLVLSLPIMTYSAETLKEIAKSLPQKTELKFIGQVIYVSIEDGFYGIVDKTGKKYYPVNLLEVLETQKLSVEELEKEKTPIEVTAEKLENTLGIQMWGEYVTILSLEVIIPVEDKDYRVDLK